MRKSFLWVLFFLLVFLILFSFSVWAQGGANIENPLRWTTFRELFGAIVNLLFNLALVVAPLMIVIAGFYFITSAGDPGKVKTAQQIILYTLIGLLIILLSKGIIALLEEVLRVRRR